MSSYIGATPTIGGYHKLDAITTDGSASYTMQLDSANFVPESVNHLIVSVNGVIQAPTDSFTVSGSTITFASSLSASDTIDFIMALGNVLDIGVPSDSTVSLSKLTATGTKDATTFLRGDNTFAVPAGGENTPAFSARATSDHTLSNNTFTKLQYNTEDYDTDSAYDNSNYRFTVPSGKAGKYLFTYGFVIGTLDGNERIDISLYLNGSVYRPSLVQDTMSFTSIKYVRASCTVDLSVGDYIEVFGRHNQGSSQDLEAINNNIFQGHRLIGV